MYKRESLQRGSMLLEALVALLLLGAGFVAFMQLHGKMSSGVSVSKARAEAMQIAQQRSQEMRSYITRQQFNATMQDVSPTEVEPPGVNARFYEKVLVRPAGCFAEPSTAWCSDTTVDNPDGEYFEVMVQVYWNDESGETQQVFLNNYIRFSDPVLSALLSKQETLNTPLTRRNRWGDERVEEGTGGEGVGRIPSDPNKNVGNTSGLGIDLYKQQNSKGNWELVNAGGTVVLTAYGGILHEIRGTVYFQDTSMNASDVKNLEVLATSPSHCEMEQCNGDGDEASCMSNGNYQLDYVCWVPGDCTNQATYDADGNYSDLIDNYIGECLPTVDGVSNADHFERIRRLDLAGGWYGRVGVYGVQENPFDDIVTGDSCDSPSRNYVALRLLANNDLQCNTPLYIDTSDANADYVVPANTEFVLTNPGYIYDSENTRLVNGYCLDPDTNDSSEAWDTYEITGNEGINTSYTDHQNFWLVDKDVKDVACPQVVQNAWCEGDGSVDNEGKIINVGLMPSNVLRTLTSDEYADIRAPNTVSWNGTPSDGLIDGDGNADGFIDYPYTDLVPIADVTCP
jgi:Tfp pilus assembly protein PilV